MILRVYIFASSAKKHPQICLYTFIFAAFWYQKRPQPPLDVSPYIKFCAFLVEKKDPEAAPCIFIHHFAAF